MNALLCRLSIAIQLAAALPAGAAAFQENFATDPFVRGWRTFGDTSLFHWNPANQNLEVTWDSSHTNSFCYLPFGTIVTKSDDFSFSFDVRLSDIHLGTTPGKTNEFEIALGLIHYASATRTNAFRGAGQSSLYGVRNVIEFDYFPDAGYGETFASTVISTNNHIYPAHNVSLQMTIGDTFRITFTYTASNQLLRTSATKNGAPFGNPPNNTLYDLALAGAVHGPSFRVDNFRVDSFAVISYSDAIQSGRPGSVLAHGVLDNVQVVVPPPPVSSLHLAFTNSLWHAQFISATSWTYTLERTPDLISWIPSSTATAGTGSMLSLQDTNPSTPQAFYRVRAERP